MAEESQASDSTKWQLIVAIGLAILVVILFNLNQARILKAQKGETVELLIYARGLRVGDRVSTKDITVREISSRGAEGYGRVLRNKTADRDSIVGEFLSQDVRKGEYVQWAHVTGTEEGRPSSRIGEAALFISVPIESLTSPGSDMRPGDRINLLGRFNLGGKVETVRVIENVRVLSAGGQGMSSLVSSGTGAKSSRTRSSYRSIGIEVPPEVSIQLQNLRTHLVGEYVVELRNPRDQILADTDQPGTINDKLKELARGAAVIRGGSGESPGR